MAIFKTTFFFESLQPAPAVGGSAVATWTETWYQDAATLEAALTFALTPANFATPRRNILSGLYHMTWVRVVSEANPRAAKVGVLNLQGAIRVGEVNHPVENLFAPAQVTCCVLVDFTVLPTGDDAVAHHRRFLLRGLPNTLIQGNVIASGSPHLNALRAFLDFMGNHELPAAAHAAVSPWRMKMIPSFATTSNITALVVDANNPTRISVTALHAAILVGQKVKLKGVQYPRGVNRIWTLVQDSAANAAMVLEKSRFNILGDWNNSGRAQVLAYRYQAANQYLVIGLRVKKTGSSPFRGSRGRRSAG